MVLFCLWLKDAAKAVFPVPVERDATTEILMEPEENAVLSIIVSCLFQ